MELILVAFGFSDVIFVFASTVASFPVVLITFLATYLSLNIVLHQRTAIKASFSVAMVSFASIDFY